MMSREQMQAILSTMDSGKMAEALSAVGINCGHCGGPELGEEEGDESLSSWNETDVRVPQSKRGPLFDKTKLVEPEARAQPQMAQVLGAQEPSGMEGFAADPSMTAGY